MTSGSLAESLAESKRRGLSWELAWPKALQEATIPREWRSRASGEETILDFAERHLEAAFRGDEAARYCAGECGRLLEPGARWCSSCRPSPANIEDHGIPAPA